LVNKVRLWNSGIIVAPTGSGKTVIALRVCLNYLEFGLILYLAPTVVLVQQQFKMFRQNLLEDIEVTLLTASDKERTYKFQNTNSRSIIFSTPHIIANDLRSEKISLKYIKLIIFDEVHNITFSYPYDQIIKRMENLVCLGLTASPGYKKQDILELKNLLKSENIIIANPPRPKVQRITRYLELPKQIIDISKSLNLIIKQDLELISRHIKVTENIYQLRLKVLEKIKQDYNYFRLLKVVTKIIKIKHIDYLITTQDIRLALEYLNSEKGKVQYLQEIRNTLNKVKIQESQKIKELLNILESIDLEKSKGIIFVQYRAIANILIQVLNKKKIKSGLLIGQKSGLKRKEQTAVVRSLRQGLIKLLIATSVGQEGLDIPNLDFVIIFSPSYNPRRDIQRTGRTGRIKQGKIYYLIYKNTSDQRYYKLSVLRQNKFKDLINNEK
jgi:ERCC4-related helicase